MKDEMPLSTPPGSRRAAALGLGLLLLAFVLLQTLMPLRTAVHIGADEGFELAKATLCAQGHKLYTEIWNDQPPLHTFLITQLIRHISPALLGPRLVTSAFTLILLASLFFLIRRFNGLATAVIAVGLLMASPGFLELSASCMLEIPALATVVAGLSLLACRRANTVWVEVGAGMLFGLALQIKLISLIWTPLAGMLIVHQQMLAKGQTFSWPTLFSTAKSFASLKRMALFAGVVILTWLAVDWIVDRGAYLAHFQQSWRSHFAAVKNTEYGSPADHTFDWLVLLRNWDMLLPALAGLLLAGRSSCRQFALGFPLVWFLMALLIFGSHKPWWPYYYVHQALPLGWLAAVGFQAASRKGWRAAKKAFAAKRKRRKAWPEAVPLAGVAVFAMLAAAWMGGRIYLEIGTMWRQPRTYSSLVLTEVKHYQPYTHWLLADELALSFLTEIPLPPSLAVLPLKRFWSGEMTSEGVVTEFTRYQPELVILNNRTQWVPYRDLLDRDYRLVYQDNEFQLFVRKTVLKPMKPQPGG